jgi:NitT/TauT family transport system permease protein
VVSLIRDPTVWNAFIVSNQALVLGFAISILLGIPLGLLIARYRSAEEYIDPYLSMLLVTPMAALIPIIVMSPLGIG